MSEPALYTIPALRGNLKSGVFVVLKRPYPPIILLIPAFAKNTRHGPKNPYCPPAEPDLKYRLIIENSANFWRIDVHLNNNGPLGAIVHNVEKRRLSGGFRTTLLIHNNFLFQLIVLMRLLLTFLQGKERGENQRND